MSNALRNMTTPRRGNVHTQYKERILVWLQQQPYEVRIIDIRKAMAIPEPAIRAALEALVMEGHVDRETFSGGKPTLFQSKKGI